MRPARAAAVFVTASLGAGAWHLLLNSTPPSFDDAWYLETSFRLFSALKHGPGAFAAEYASAFRIKAPLISLLPLPLYAIFGAGERVAAWANLFALGAACAAVFAAAEALWPEHPRRREVASLAAALTALIPLLYGVSRYFLVEPLLTALVCACVWRLALAGRHPATDAPALGALLGAGLLAKILFPLYVAGPVWLSRGRLRRLAKGVLLVAVPLTATWYAFNLPYVLGFAWSAGFGRVASDYGSAGGGGYLSFLGSLFGGALSWPLSAAMALVFAAAAFGAGKTRLDEGTRVALAWTAPLLVFAFGVNREIRLVAPVLPAFALLAARAAMSFVSARARAAAAAALLLAGSGVFVRQTFVAGPGAALPWCGAPSLDGGWDRAALVSAAAADGARVAAVSIEHPALNANNLSSLAAARGLDLKFVSLGYAQRSAEGAMIRLKDKDADRLILVAGVDPNRLPAFLNRANADVAAAVASGRLPARLRTRVSLGPGVEALVYGIGRGM